MTAAAVAILSADRVAGGNPTADDRELFQLEAELAAALARDRASNSVSLLCVEAAAADASASLSKCFALAEEILQTPATTLAGIMVKLRLQHVSFIQSEGYAELLESVTADLERWPRRHRLADASRTSIDGHGNPPPETHAHAHRWPNAVTIGWLIAERMG